MYSEKDILSMEVIKGMSDGEPVSGLMYLKDYTKKPTKNGGFFIDGTSEVKGAIQFKAWGNSVAFSKRRLHRSCSMGKWKGKSFRRCYISDY